MSINCIAIDDDPHALESLISYMDELPNLELIQSFTDPLKAFAEISTANPVDIIFMDIEMPVLSGLELAMLLRQKTKHLIFTTAHSRYAIDAFKVEADAYLLKPYSILHFAKTINSLYPTGLKETDLLWEDSFFHITVGNEENLVQIEINELVSIETFEDEIRLKTISSAFECSRSSFISTLRILRNHPAFIQISQTVIIAKQHIKGVFGNKTLLSGGISFNVAASHQSAFSSFLNSNL